ncbi:DUF6345 domain-containing protein [Caldicellulosiruptor acetigenus]|uniref:Uncharacterized protein n=1 Tax=Caldicellulosiruptor acetigenus 6A TaxID=632516 RepID=G2PXE9_9FIRM|nr:DUF6345 domain-containing protein [Caldicellulosiruptor acetigenus]AEM74813.1 hypothetical protein Calla_2271 [Caldicellulosiruptor acetigenus 6A]
MRAKKFLAFIILSLILFNSCFGVSANLSGCFLGVSKYSSIWPWEGNCQFGDRAGAQYVTNLKNGLSSVMNAAFVKLNSDANESQLKNVNLTSSYDLLAYSGHGLMFDKENAAHFFARSTGESWHNSKMEYNDEVNARTNEVRFGHNKLKWIIMYTCNWLTNNGDQEKLENIFKTFEGATLTMGFASVMYLDSREATLFAQLLVQQKKSFKDAFLEAARKYQPQRKNGDSIARIQGYTAAANDSLYNYIDCLPSSKWYKNYKSGYSIIKTEIIPHNGQPVQ